MKSIRAIGQMMQARNYSNNRCVQHACTPRLQYRLDFYRALALDVPLAVS